MNILLLIKCESCGAPLKFEDGQSYAICEYCGTQTIFNMPEVKSIPINNISDNIEQNPNKFF